MTNEALQETITALIPDTQFETGAEWLTITTDAAAIKPLLTALRQTAGLDFDYLFCLSGVDWKTHFNIVYHLSSTTQRHTVVVKAKVNRDNPEIDTVSDIWRTAEFHELEAYDLFGIIFTGHPGLRRLFLTDDWKGWPLRKDYEDPINMIKL